MTRKSSTPKSSTRVTASEAGSRRGPDEPRPAGAGEGSALALATAGRSVEDLLRAPAAARGAERRDQVEQDLDALLADAEAKKDEYLELAKRTQADFENFRKRMSG